MKNNRMYVKNQWMYETLEKKWNFRSNQTRDFNWTVKKVLFFVARREREGA